MVDVVLNLLYGSTSIALSDNQALLVCGCACVLVLMAFGFISLAFYKLMLYICKF